LAAFSHEYNSNRYNRRFDMTDQMTMTKEETTRKEEFQVTGEMLLTKIKELVHEGNVRRILIKNEAGNVIAEFPMSAGVVGAILLPVWAAIGAIAALAADLTIVVERRD
jgi:hypothetical protein